MKKALPLLAIMFVCGLVGRSITLAYLQAGPTAIAGVTVEDGRLVMANPRLDGFNDDRRRYEMTASRALQKISDATSVDLEEIAAKLPSGSAAWAMVEAARGTMTKADNMLRITSPALVKTTDGLIARLKSGRFDISRGDITSDEPVEVDRPNMKITADRMSRTDGGDVMVFEQRVRVVIDGRSVDTAAAGPTNASN